MPRKTSPPVSTPSTAPARAVPTTRPGAGAGKATPKRKSRAAETPEKRPAAAKRPEDTPAAAERDKARKGRRAAGRPAREVSSTRSTPVAEADATPLADVVDPELEALDGRISKAFRRIDGHTRKLARLGRERIELARGIGEMLAEAPTGVVHGEWADWISEHCEFEEWLDRNYIRLFEHWHEVEPLLEPKRQPVAVSTVKGVLRALAQARRSREPAPAGGCAEVILDGGVVEPLAVEVLDDQGPVGREADPGQAALEPPPAEPAGPRAWPAPEAESTDRPGGGEGGDPDGHGAPGATTTAAEESPRAAADGKVTQKAELSIREMRADLAIVNDLIKWVRATRARLVEAGLVSARHL
jgi:hypothetical protein